MLRWTAKAKEAPRRLRDSPTESSGSASSFLAASQDWVNRVGSTCCRYDSQPPCRGDHTEAPRPDAAGDTLGDTVSPSVSGHQMQQLCSIFNNLLPITIALPLPDLL